MARDRNTGGSRRFGRLFNRRVLLAALVVVAVEIIAAQAGAAPGLLPASQTVTVTVPQTPTPTPPPTLTPTPTATSIPATIAVIEAGSLTLGAGKTGSVEVIVRDITSVDGLEGFGLYVSFDPAVISVGSPLGGDAPFGTLL